MVSDDGDYKLGDFGVARTLDSGRTSYMSRKGTEHYMAPELIRMENNCDSRVDIYSLGIVLYKLLNSNRFPFYPSYPKHISPRDQEVAFNKRISGVQLDFPTNADGRLAEIVLKACAFRKEERYPSPKQMFDELYIINYSSEEANIIYKNGDWIAIPSLHEYVKQSDNTTEISERTITIGSKAESTKESKKRQVLRKKTYFTTIAVLIGIVIIITAIFLVQRKMGNISATQVDFDNTKMVTPFETLESLATSPTIAPTELPETITLINTEGYGNNPDNLSALYQGGFAVCWKNRIYFANHGQVGIVSMNCDGSDIKIFREGHFLGLNAVDESLFFSDGSVIYRVEGNGAEFSFQAPSTSVDYLCYYNGYLYYCGQATTGIPAYKMSRVRSDFKENQELCELSVKPESIIVAENQVYYRDALLGSAGVFETNWLTGETRNIITTSTNTINFYNGQLYSCETGQPLAVTSLTTGSEITLDNSSGMDLERVLENGNIFFSFDGASKSGVWIYNMENGAKQPIWEYENNNFNFNIAGGWIFARTYLGEVYAIRLPGGNEQLLVDENKSITITNAKNWESTVIEWKDKDVEFCIRRALEKPDGDITFEETSAVSKLFFWGNAFATQSELTTSLSYSNDIEFNGDHYIYRTFHNLSDLCWFTSLEQLWFDYGTLKCSLSPLASLDRLSSLYLRTNGSFQYSKGSLGELKQVKELRIDEISPNIDLSCLEGMSSLERLDFGAPVKDTSALVGLNNLKLVVFEYTVTEDAYEYLAEKRPDIKIIASYVN